MRPTGEKGEGGGVIYACVQLNFRERAAGAHRERVHLDLAAYIRDYYHTGMRAIQGEAFKLTQPEYLENEE